MKFPEYRILMDFQLSDILSGSCYFSHVRKDFGFSSLSSHLISSFNTPALEFSVACVIGLSLFFTPMSTEADHNVRNSPRR